MDYNFVAILIVVLILILYYKYKNRHEANSRSIIKLIDKGPVFVDFYAPWCQYCKDLKPEFDKLISKGVDGVEIKYFSAITQTPPPSVQISSFPTIVLFYKGLPIQYNGERKADHMEAWIKHVILTIDAAELNRQNAQKAQATAQTANTK